MAEQTSKALVLGGGGPVGIAWELGIAAGLLEGGIDLRIADRVIGTSAGSIAGALLASGEDPLSLVDQVELLISEGAATSGADQVAPEGMARMLELTLASAELDDEDARAANRAEMGAFALDAATIPEDDFVGTIGSVLAGRPWPRGFACTAVRAQDGSFHVWEAHSEVPLERAVASSCAVPGIYPPITIGDHRYIDGGMRSGLNADLAAGAHATVVVSCMPLELPPGLDDPRIARLLGRSRAEIDAVQAAGADVALIVPDLEFLAISGFGMNLMDFTQVGPAAEAGQRLGRAEADRVAAVWSAAQGR
jgi:NTE family protein